MAKPQTETERKYMTAMNRERDAQKRFQNAHGNGYHEDAGRWAAEAGKQRNLAMELWEQIQKERMERD